LRWLLGGRDGRLLLVAVGAVLGAPVAALAAVTATSALSLGRRSASSAARRLATWASGVSRPGWEGPSGVQLTCAVAMPVRSGRCPLGELHRPQLLAVRRDVGGDPLGRFGHLGRVDAE
jgi:hypothetical protein